MGKALYVDRYISFLGDVDPNTGYLNINNEKVSLKGRIFIFKGSRGSSVGSFIIYGLSRNRVAPGAMIVENVDPILIAGCVLGNIILIQVDSIDPLREMNNKVLKVETNSNSGIGVIFIDRNTNSY